MWEFTAITQIVGNNTNTLRFQYLPDGKHKDLAGEQVRNGNELIEWIQNGHEEIPPRPFWNNFVSEMEQGGIIDAFITGMLPFNITRDSSDSFIDLGASMLSGGMTFDINSMEDATGEDELPF